MGDTLVRSSRINEPSTPGRRPPAHKIVGRHARESFPQIERGEAPPPLLPAQEHARAGSLQRALGNRATAKMLGAQAKLTVGLVGDALEVEADRVAERVMRMEDPGAGGVIQRKCAESSPHALPNVQVHAASRHGTSGPSGPLPWLDVIQRTFGRHDVSGIAGHTDSAAAEGARAMNAVAFTAGEHVAFSGKPTLHTAAHEAAHAIQQRAGIQISGGVGVAGDRYEHHADAVADLVVKGQSAEALLDEPFEGSSAPPVQQRSVGNRAVVRLVQREPPTRDEMLAKLKTELADAATDPAKYDAVALRFNGFNKADSQRLAAGLSVEQARGTRAAAERVLAGWPEQQTVLDALDAGTVAKGVHLRPQSSSIWAAYDTIRRSAATPRKVWEHVGGSVAQSFEKAATCATRLSYAFNYGGSPIQGSNPGWIYRNDPQVTYKGKAGDGKRYIVSAPFMAEFLRSQWGPPDATLKTTKETSDYRDSLRPDQVAVFAGAAHSGLITQLAKDLYVYDARSSVLPVVVWKLP